MADKVVYDMSVYSETSTTIFAAKSWVAIQDNQNGSYAGGQSVLETSSISNSDKWANYREAYLAIPLVVTLTSSGADGTHLTGIQPRDDATSCDFFVGLKNWYGSIIHSFTCDVGGVTRIQQTPYQSLWNCFKLMSSLSYDDLLGQGASIGFYPDTSTGVNFRATYVQATNGIGTCNNSNAIAPVVVKGALSSLGNCNEGFLKRQLMTNLNPLGLTDVAGAAYSTLIAADRLTQSYKSYIYNTVDTVGAGAVPGVWQLAIMAQVKLRHLHDMFENIPLSKGLFLKMTMALNQTSVSAQITNDNTLTGVTVNSPLGGVSPIMLASLAGNNGGNAVFAFDTGAATMTCSIAVGNRVLNTTQATLAGVQNSPFTPNIQLYVPLYTFASGMEAPYITTPAKTFTYGDIFQYNVNSIGSGSNFNNLVSNGVSNIKRVLVLPFYTTAANELNPLQSPFDPAGGGPTSPFCLLSNFNVMISGQNAIYNTQKYSYEQYMNQFSGVMSKNGGLVDGDTSGLVSQLDFETEYCYYLVDVSRMNEVEKMIPKSVTVTGTNMSAKAIDLYIFVEYEVKCTFDVVNGLSY